MENTCGKMTYIEGTGWVCEDCPDWTSPCVINKELGTAEVERKEKRNG